VDDVLTRLRDAAPAAFSDTPVLFAYLFGSHAAGTATPRSDIDVAVYCRADIVDAVELRLRLAATLEQLTGLPDIEVVVLNQASTALAGRVQECHDLLYSVDEVTRVRYQSSVSRQYHDFKIHQDRSARERLAQLAAGR
jgi:predicted nucleotidyltransferase